MIPMFMRWRRRQPAVRKKFVVNLKVQSLESIGNVSNGHDEHASEMTMMVELKWCGSKHAPGKTPRQNQKTDQTTETRVEHGCAIINWQQEFQHLCILTMAGKQEPSYVPFYVHFTIVQLDNRTKSTVFGTTSINLGDFASTQTMEQTVKLNIRSPQEQEEQKGTLEVTMCFSEELLRTLNLDPGGNPTLSRLGCGFLCDQQIRTTRKSKVKLMRKTVSFGMTKVFGELECFTCGCKPLARLKRRSIQDAEASDNDSITCSDGRKSIDDACTWLRSYGSLSGANLLVEGVVPSLKEFREDPFQASIESDTDNVPTPQPNRDVNPCQLLPWKRKQNSQSLPESGQPLLRKSNKDTGGDDNDLVRHLSFTLLDDQRQEVESALLSSEAMSECLDCGEVQFSVGCWEKREFVSRVGHMKILAKVFFASIDQRSEQAGGESACAVLAAVIADWLHQNPGLMPIRADLDTLIRKGSAEWRTLCNNELYSRRFPDQHFDLDTVLEAKIRPLRVAEGGVSVGFFTPEKEDSSFDFLNGTASFDDIWEATVVEESLRMASTHSSQPVVYIVSWNDHFFLLKVDEDAYYIIDTLGERLFEGCKQAYMICFDEETVLTQHVGADEKLNGRKQDPPNAPSSLQKTSLNEGTSAAGPSSVLPCPQQVNESADSSHFLNHNSIEKGTNAKLDDEIECTGKDTCREFIKGFFAALSLKQLCKEIEKTLPGTATLHRRLQIEFHQTCIS